jgi:hypothetical protein
MFFTMRAVDQFTSDKPGKAMRDYSPGCEVIDAIL